MDHKQPSVKNLERGQYLLRQKGDIMAVTWQDKKLVHLIATIPTGNQVNKVTRKVKKNGKWENKKFDCSEIVLVYNSNMGGVDIGDQRIGTYKKHFRTSTWYLALSYYCLEQCCLNAFVYEQATPLHHQPKRTQLKFQVNLAEQLIGGRTYVKKPGRPSNPLPEKMRFNRQQFHYPMRIGEANERRDCVVLQSIRTNFKCAVCESPMCPEMFFQVSHHVGFCI